MPWLLIMFVSGIIMRFGLSDGANGWDFNFHLVGDIFIVISVFLFVLTLLFAATVTRAVKNNRF